MIEQLQSIAGAGGLRAELSASAATPASAAQIGGASFGEVLRDQIAATIDTVKSAEGASAAGLQGEMDVRQVTDAVMSAERNLQAAVAIRDKIVTAYLDMTRMAI